MKDKLNQLESLNRELMCKLDIKSRYQQIKELMGERKYFETERDIFCVGDAAAPRLAGWVRMLNRRYEIKRNDSYFIEY